LKELSESRTATRQHGYSTVDMTIVMTVAVMLGLVYMLAQGDHNFLYLLSNGLPPLLAFTAFAVATAGLVHNGVSVKNRFSIVWLGYALGMLLWFLGESTWAVYALGYSIPNPFPSIADGFWLAGYVPLICAVLMQSWPFREFLLSRRMLTVISVVICVAGLLLSAIIPPTYASNVGQSLVSVAVGLAYPLLDVALLVVGLPILFLYGRGTFWRPFLLVTIGLIFTFLGDILFTWTSLNGTYYDGSYLELFFHWSYLILAYGFYVRFRSGVGASMLE
jgi:hypothetical protein